MIFHSSQLWKIWNHYVEFKIMLLFKKKSLHLESITLIFTWISISPRIFPVARQMNGHRIGGKVKADYYLLWCLYRYPTASSHWNIYKVNRKSITVKWKLYRTFKLRLPDNESRAQRLAAFSKYSISVGNRHNIRYVHEGLVTVRCRMKRLHILNPIWIVG